MEECLPIEMAAEPGLTQTLGSLLKGCGDSSNDHPLASHATAPIHAAAAAGHCAVVQALLNEGMRADAVDESTGHSLLIAATAAGHVDVISLLLKAGADAGAAPAPPASAAAGESALTLACRTCHHPALAALLSEGASPNVCDGRGVSLLMLCAAHTPVDPAGDCSLASCLHLLLRDPGGASLAAVDLDGTTALTHAAAAGNHAAAAALLEAPGGNLTVNLPDKRGRTPLQLSSSLGHEALCSLCLGAGARIDEADLEGDTALMRASGSGQLPVMRRPAWGPDPL